MEHDHTNKHFITLTFALCTLVFIFMIFLVFIQKNQQTILRQALFDKALSQQDKSASIQSLRQQAEGGLTAIPAATGRLFLTTKDNKKNYTLSEPIHLILHAHSYGHVIVGYDVVLRFDTSKIAFISAKSLNPSFDIYINKTDTVLTITGTKKLAGTTKTVLADTALAELIFTPIKTGSVAVAFDFVEGVISDSNLIDENSTDVLRSVAGLTLGIEYALK